MEKPCLDTSDGGHLDGGLPSSTCRVKGEWLGRADWVDGGWEAIPCRPGLVPSFRCRAFNRARFGDLVCGIPASGRVLCMRDEPVANRRAMDEWEVYKDQLV